MSRVPEVRSNLTAKSTKAYAKVAKYLISIGFLLFFAGFQSAFRSNGFGKIACSFNNKHHKLPDKPIETKSKYFFMLFY